MLNTIYFHINFNWNSHQNSLRAHAFAAQSSDKFKFFGKIYFINSSKEMPGYSLGSRNFCFQIVTTCHPRKVIPKVSDDSACWKYNCELPGEPSGRWVQKAHLYTRNRLCMMSCHRYGEPDLLRTSEITRWSERDKMEGARPLDGQAGEGKKKKKEHSLREGTERRQRKRETMRGRRRKNAALRKRGMRDGTTKKAGRIIIKRQGDKITHGAALASIHAFYSLAVIARTDRLVSYHLASPAQSSHP